MHALALSGGKDSMACLHLLRDELDCAIYVDTGYSYPETWDMIRAAMELLPVHTINADRQGQNARYGIPADVVPIDWSYDGQQLTQPRPVMIQSYVQCCLENIGLPLLAKAKDLGVTTLIYGQRRQDSHRSTAKDGDVIEGIVRRHPIEDWTTQEVFEYLDTKMTIPAHYFIQHSSLDCYDCPAYQRESQDRVAWMKERYPERYHAYAIRASQVYHTLADALEVR